MERMPVIINGKMEIVDIEFRKEKILEDFRRLSLNLQELALTKIKENADTGNVDNT